MKVTLERISTSMDILQKIKQQNPELKISYWYMRNFKALVESYNFFIENRNKVLDYYCTKGDDGQYFTITEDGKLVFNLKELNQADNFDKEMNDLLKMECDIEPYIMSLDTLNSSNFKLNANDVFVIDYMLPS